jgi:hypothetical protein
VSRAEIRLCAVSVDLDEMANYHALHGLDLPSGEAAHAVYDRGLERLDDWARSLEVPLTLFAIGADLERRENADRLKALGERGREIGNHTLNHRYDLTRLGRDEMLGQIEKGARAIQEATGYVPVGFRAPGYTVTDTLFEVLSELGPEYDSSVFPCPAYYGAKAMALALLRVRGRQSHSMLDRPSVLRAPTRPYRIGRPYWKRGNGLLELPIQVTRGLRLPFIGTSLVLLGPTRARWLTRQVLGVPLVNLELHGIDALDESDGLETLRGHQPDISIPVSRKLEALASAIETLRSEGYAFVQLREAPEALRGAGLA